MTIPDSTPTELARALCDADGKVSWTPDIPACYHHQAAALAPWLAERERAVRVQALREARDEISGMLDRFPRRGAQTRARWAVGWLDLIIDRTELAEPKES